MNKIKKGLQVLLPGIFLIGYNIGTGSITAMSKAGASFGYDLLWTILLSCIITFYLLDQFSLYTIVAGESVILGIKKHIHPSISWFLTTALVIIILAALLGITGILADTIHEGVTLLTGKQFSRLWTITTLGIIIVGILISGSNKAFENVLAIIVGIMGLAFILAVINLSPSLLAVGKGLIPAIPESSGDSDNNGLVIVAGMTGTTVSAVVFIIRSLIVKEARWTIKNIKSQRIDAANSAFFMFLISAAVMAVAAETLFPIGVRVNNVPELLPILKPVAGTFAVGIVIVGIAAAGLSSVLPNILAISWLIKDYKEDPKPLKKPSIWVILILVFYCTIGTMFGFKPIFLMLISQACLAVLLPVLLISTVYLLHNKMIMGEHKMKGVSVLVWTIILCYSLIMSSLGINGLIKDLEKLLN